MKTNKILVGGLAGGVIYFLLGWLIYGVLLMDYMTASYNQCAAKPMEEMIWWAMIVSNFAFGFLFAFLFSWSNSRGVLSGLKIAMIFGFLLAVNLDLGFYSMTNMFPDLMTAIVDIVISTVFNAIAGVLIILVMDRVK